MSNRQTVASYAAGASLAAVALIYVFGPTFTLDDEKSSRKKTIVGLRNSANDCFINSVLQALAGLDDLRVYLIRETHRRAIEDPAVYAQLVQPGGGIPPMPDWKLTGLQDGLVTFGLKEMLDSLNERPIYKKAITPFPLIRVLETAFRQRISRQQQDAQEFLQIVAERLKDEYHAGRRARLHARTYGVNIVPGGPLGATGDDVNEKNQGGAEDAVGASSGSDDPDDAQVPALTVQDADTSATDMSSTTTGANTPRTPPPALASTAGGIEKLKLPVDSEEAFPMEGKYESQLQCMTCRYRSKPREESFCTLTLAVPQVASTTLASCFDGVFKTEHIDDFKCENCRLVQVKTRLEADLARLSPDSPQRMETEDSIEKLRVAIETDPENPPEDVDLGDGRDAPRRKISKTTRIVDFPKILAVHLSRSIYGGGQMMQKNSAKVSFPEHLPLGGLLDQRRYKLLGVVTHKGGHNSGHYEAFRRQQVSRPPFAHLNTFQQSEVYSRTPTPISTPEMAARRMNSSPAVSTPDLLSPTPGSGKGSPTQSMESMVPIPRSVPQEGNGNRSSGSSTGPATTPKDKDAAETGSLRSVAASTKSALAKLASPRSQEHLSNQGDSAPSVPKPHRRRKPPAEKWWRVSDEKVRECKTGELLGMQREVYLLFYELEKD